MDQSKSQGSSKEMDNTLRHWTKDWYVIINIHLGHNIYDFFSDTSGQSGSDSDGTSSTTDKEGEDEDGDEEDEV